MRQDIISEVQSIINTNIEDSIVNAEAKEYLTGILNVNQKIKDELTAINSSFGDGQRDHLFFGGLLETLKHLLEQKGCILDYKLSQKEKKDKKEKGLYEIDLSRLSTITKQWKTHGFKSEDDYLVFLLKEQLGF